MRGGFAGLALIAACYSPTVPAGVACGPGDACPVGQQCVDGFCRIDPPAADARDDGSLTDDGAPMDGASAGFTVPVLIPELASNGDDFGPSISSDGLELFFNSDRMGSFRLYVALRASPTEAFGAPAVIAELDGTGSEYDADVSRDRRELHFVSDDNPDGLRVTTRPDPASPWATPTIVTGGNDREGPSLAVNDSILLLARSGIEEYARTGPGAAWQLLRTHTNLNNHSYPGVSSDGLEVFTARSGRIYRATRTSLFVPFGPPARVLFGAPFDNDHDLVDPELSADGKTLYLSARRSGHYDIYVTTR